MKSETSCCGGQKLEPQAVDPVCKISVDRANAKATFDWQGKTYYFCCVGCQRKFSSEPDKYLAPVEATKSCCGRHENSEPTLAIMKEATKQGCCSSAKSEATSEPVKIRDPICGMSVTATTTAHQLVFEGVTYYFCCTG